MVDGDYTIVPSGEYSRLRYAQEQLESTEGADGMPDYDGMEHEELVIAAQFNWLKRAELEDANAALERELKSARGELSVTLNNWEQAKGKIRREKDELANRRKKLDELAANPEGPLHAKIERLEERCEKLEAERDSLKAKLEAVKEAVS